MRSIVFLSTLLIATLAAGLYLVMNQHIVLGGSLVFLYGLIVMGIQVKDV